MTAQQEFVSSIVSKCNKSSLSHTLKQWGILEDSDVDNLFTKGATKATIANKLLDLISQNSDLDLENLGNLELTYVQMHSQRKSWKVYKAIDCADENLNFDPRRLRARVIRKAGALWKDGDVSGNVNVYSGAVWMRLHFDSSRARRKSKSKPKLYNPTQSVFVVAFHDSPHVIISKTTVRLTKILIQCVLHMYEARELKDIKLSGRHVTSLADLVHRRFGEGVSSMYRDEEMKENPLCPGACEDRLRDDDFSEAEEAAEGIIDENMELKSSRREFMKEKFGSSRQPLLEHVDYQFNVKFGGRGDLCVSSVVLRGPSVLKGLSQMSALGLVKHPLPPHLTGITAQTRNSFNIADRRRTRTR